MNVEESLELVILETDIGLEKARSDFEMYAAEIQKCDNLSGNKITSREDIAWLYAADVLMNYRMSVSLQNEGYVAKQVPIIKPVDTPEESGHYTKARPSITNGYNRSSRIGGIFGGMR